MKKYLVVGVVILIIGAYFVFNWLDQPSSGSIQTKSNDDVLSASKSNVNLSANLFSTYYDSSLRLKSSNESSSGPIFSQYLLASKISGNDSQIAITVADLQDSLVDVSPAKFRLIDPDLYTQSNVAFAPEGSLVFIKNSDSNYEIAIIWSNNNYYSAVVGSGTTANKIQIDEYVSDVVTKWKWQ